MDVIAERRMQLRTSTGSIEVVVKLGRPIPDESLDSWKCEYQIHFGDTVRSMAMHGSDALQALQLSIATLDVELEHGAKRRGGVLWHLDERFTSVLEHSGLQVRSAAGGAK